MYSRIQRIISYKSFIKANFVRCNAISTGMIRHIALPTISNVSYKKHFQKIKNSYENVSCVNLNDINNCLSCVYQSCNLTSSDALFLLQCCGKPTILTDGATRQNLLQELWDFMIKSEIFLDVSHYNALISCYIENEKDINFEEILESMKDNEIEPDIVTYTKFIEFYCKKGEINAAYGILETMKSKNMAIGEDIFHSLILGNARVKNYEGCQSIAESCKARGLENDMGILESLLVACAELNKIEEANAIFNEIVDKKIDANMEKMRDAYYHFALYDNKELCERILQEIPSYTKIDIFLNCIKNLIINGKQDYAYMLANQVLEKHLVHSIILLICKYSKKFEDVRIFLLKWYKETNTDNGLVYALKHYLDNSDITNSLNVLETMVDNSLYIRDAYLYPVICLCHSLPAGEQLDKMEQILKLVEDPKNFRRGLEDFVLPMLWPNLSPFQILKWSHVKVSGLFPFGVVVCQKLLITGKYQSLVRTAEGLRPFSILSSTELSDLLCKSAIYHLHSIDTIGRIVSIPEAKHIQSDENSPSNKVSFLRLLHSKIDHRDDKEYIMLNMLKALQKYSCYLSKEDIEELIRDCNSINSEGKEILSSLSKYSSILLPGKGNFYDCTEERFKENLKEFAKIKEIPDAAVLTMVHFCKNRKANEDTLLLFRVLRNANYRKHIISLFNNMILNKNFQGAEEIFEYIEEQNLDIYRTQILRYASLLICNGKFDDALNVLKYPSQVNRDDYPDLKSFCQTALNLCTPEQIEEIESLLKSNLPDMFIPFISSKHVFDSNGNIEEAIKHFEENPRNMQCLTRYQFSLFIRKVVKTNDDSLINRAVGFSAKTHGKIDTNILLAYCYFMNGNKRKCMKTINEGTFKKYLSSIVNYLRFISEEDINLLPSFVELLKSVVEEKLDFFSFIIDTYIAHDKPEYGLKAWILSQEMDLVLPRNVLHRLAALLSRHNMAVPFKVDGQAIKPEPLASRNEKWHSVRLFHEKLKFCLNKKLSNSDIVTELENIPDINKLSLHGLLVDYFQIMDDNERDHYLDNIANKVLDQSIPYYPYLILVHAIRNYPQSASKVIAIANAFKECYEETEMLRIAWSELKQQGLTMQAKKIYNNFNHADKVLAKSIVNRRNDRF